jgi:hypothetical protein
MAEEFASFILPQLMAKKIFALMFGVLILNSATEIHQLLKLPFLIQHYLHHRDEDSSMSIVDFLKIHYSDGQHPNDNDDSDDNELPFKSIGDISHIDIPILEKRTTAYSTIYQREKSIAYYPEGIPAHRSFSIFHPPRAV